MSEKRQPAGGKRVTFLGGDLWETKEFAKQRKKNKIKRDMAKKSRKQNRNK